MTVIEGDRVLIVGSGGREHALVWKLAQSPGIEAIYIAPGNGGTDWVGTNVDIAADDVSALAQFASDQKVSLTVVGPEVPLAAGIVDAFKEDGLSIFGPSKEAAKLETDKAWATGFMERHGIPHPMSQIFQSYEKAREYVTHADPNNIVIKASGLAQGKGVELPETHEAAVSSLRSMMVDGAFGESGREVVIQARLTGPEVSMLAVSDGMTVVPLLPAQDHKRIFDNDSGPNTGGMGAYAPVPFVTPEVIADIHRTILQPTIDGMQEEGYPFRGILFAGLMLTTTGPKVLEYNVRFGDPETQPLMKLLESDLVPILISSIRGTLSHDHVRFRNGFAVCVVAAAGGYPGTYEKRNEIHGFPRVKQLGVEIFHAGTLMKDNTLVTNGGRVLGVTAYGLTLPVAIQRAYEVMNSISFDGMQYRKDIGAKGI